MENQVAQGNGRKKKKAFLVAALVFLIGGVALSFYVHYKSSHISTDDAFIEADVYPVASRISGTVSEVMVSDNQRVKAGDVLLTLEADDMNLTVKAKETALDTARARLKELEAKAEIGKLSLEADKSVVEAARANLELKQSVERDAQQNLQRARSLYAKEVFTKEKLDGAVTAYDVASADSRAAAEKLKQAEQALDVARAVLRQTVLEAQTQRSQIEQAEVALQTAALTLSYTAINAPASGLITRKGVEKGRHVSAGQPLMAVVDLDNIWITANYKETMLGKIKPGQTVKFSVDAWPGVMFNGTVQSIMAGTGSAFSVFPSENATGNYVKVVQRVPVKIVPEKDAFRDYQPRMGMSVVPVINLR